MDANIQDEILFETIVLHQQHEQYFTPQEIRELMERFGFWVDKIMKIFGGKDSQEKFEILKQWKAPWEGKKK